MRTVHGVPGEPNCVTCFEETCLGCALLVPPIGTCPVCGLDVRLDDFYEWRGDDPVHWDCLEEQENEQ